VKRNLGLLLGGTLAFWILLMYPARWLGLEHASLYSSVAVLLCLVPAVVTMVWAGAVPKRSPEQHLQLVLGSTFLRMGFVLGVGLVLYLGVPDFDRPSFWIWVSLFYLFTLALEVTLVVRGRRAQEQSRLP
jgi:hypothetical protein